MVVRLRCILYYFVNLLSPEGGWDVRLPGDHPISPTEIRRFCWLSYDIDFRRKAAANLSLNWGELYLMKFTGQAKLCCSICGSGDHYSYGCSLSTLRPNNTQRGLCNNYNRGTKCSQDPCPFSHRCKTCYGDHPASRHDDPPSKPRSQTDKKSSNR